MGSFFNPIGGIMKLIETINTNAQAVTSGSKIVLGNIDKSINQCAFNYNGTDTITLRQNGYYAILFKVDATSTAATQTMQVSLLGNGTTSEPAEGTAYAAAADQTYTITFFKVVKVCNIPLSVSFTNSGAASINADNVVVSILKIA